ncbi:MAG: nucleotide exchange factor GrpE [Nitrospiraceae bacterium]|nr:MAG: nucleotide exchange factor GrpE [Nitrospiraceae bacterium]
MTDTSKTDTAGDTNVPEQEVQSAAEAPKPQEEAEDRLREAQDKYVRLYADFENYKKIAARNREELLKYANEDLIKDILTVIDHLELALQHAPENEKADSLAEGVQLTLKELRSVLEKYGLETIEAVGKPFDPSVHHAMTQVESQDAGENTVVKEFRKGYSLKGRVLRAALVGVAVKPPSPGGSTGTEADESE